MRNQRADRNPEKKPGRFAPVNSRSEQRSEDRFSDAGHEWDGDSYTYKRQVKEFNRVGPYVGKGPKGYIRKDERIHDDISELITRHPEIDGTDIEVQVKNGEVTLTGFVPERVMKHIAEDLIEVSLGITDINNMIRVRKLGASASSTNLQNH